MNNIPGQVYLWVAVFLFAASNSIVRKLTDIGIHHLIDGRNPISPCNVLFVSNLCALMALIPWFRRQLNKQTLRRITNREWGLLVLVSTLSGALAPALIFTALSQTMVSNVILVGRIEPPLILLFSVCFLHIRLNRWEVVGTIVSFTGVVFTIALQPHPSNTWAMGSLLLGKGEVMTILGVSSAAIATVISKAKLEHIPLGIYTLGRLLVGTAIFFILAIMLYGTDHFIDATYPLLWKWMLIYGVGIVAIGQLCWFQGLRTVTTAEAALVNSFSAVAGIIAAYFILGEQPLFAHYVGSAIVLLGLLISQVGIWNQASSKFNVAENSFIQKMEARVGFKGI